MRFLILTVLCISLGWTAQNHFLKSSTACLLQEYLQENNEGKLICEAFADAAGELLTTTETQPVEKRQLTYTLNTEDHDVLFSDAGQHPIREATHLEMNFDAQTNVCRILLFGAGKHSQLGGHLLLMISERIQNRFSREHQHYLWFSPAQVTYPGGDTPVYNQFGHRLSKSHLSGLAASRRVHDTLDAFHNNLPEADRAMQGLYRFGDSRELVGRYVSAVYHKMVTPADQYITVKRRQKQLLFYGNLVLCLIMFFFWLNTRRGTPQEDMLDDAPEPTDVLS